MRRILVLLAPAFLVACGPEMIISSRDQVVVDAWSAADASTFAQKHCSQFNREAFYLREGRNSYWYICKDSGPALGGRQLSRINQRPSKTLPPMTHSKKIPSVSKPAPANAGMKEYPMEEKAGDNATSMPRSLTGGAPDSGMKADEKKKSKSKSAITSASSGNYWVQVASRRSRKAAKAAENKVRKRYADLIGGAGYRIVKAKIRNSKTYYRVRFGPYADSTAAYDLCNELKSRKQDCFVIVR